MEEKKKRGNATKSTHFTGGFVVVDINPVQLQVAVTVVGASRVDTMLVADDFPKLKRKFELIQ